MLKDQEPQINEEQGWEDETPQEEEIIDWKDPKTRQTGGVLLTLFCITGTIGGVIGFIAGAECGFREARREAVIMLGEESFKVEPAKRIEVVNPVEEATLTEWQETKRYYQETFNEAANFNDSTDIIKPLRQLAINHTLYGAELYNKVFVSPTFETDYRSDKLTLDGVNFDLSKPKDFHLASAIVDALVSEAHWAKIADQSNDQQLRQRAVEGIKEAEANLEDLYYIAANIENIYFTPESFLYFPKDSFVAMAKITRTLEQHGYPQPKTIMAVGIRENVAGEYFEHDLPNSPFTVILRSSIWDGGVVHEWGHFISDVSNYEEGDRDKGERASLINYQKAVDSVRFLNENQSTDLVNQYVDDNAKRNIKEDYAETFMWYFWSGDDFRAKLEELKDKDPVAFQILQAKYDFFKNVVFEEEEFHNKGISLNQQSEQKKPEAQTQENLQLGDLVKIVDKDTTSPGILLRPVLITQEWFKNEEWPAVFNGDTVEIIEGPQPVTEYVIENGQYVFENGQVVEEEANWWKVRINHQTYESYSLVGDIEGEGWISEKWFEEKVPTP